MSGASYVHLFRTLPLSIDHRLPRAFTHGALLVHVCCGDLERCRGAHRRSHPTPPSVPASAPLHADDMVPAPTPTETEMPVDDDLSFSFSFDTDDDGESSPHPRGGPLNYL